MKIINNQGMINPNAINAQQLKFRPQQQQPQQLQQPPKPIEDKSDIDLTYFNGLEDNDSKREYLGEIIFKKIENHHLAQKYEFSINKIGKTTGMILAFDDLNVIMDICRNEESLAAYIEEANDLLKDPKN